MSPDKMIRMANQIAMFFTHAEPADAATHIATHINDFWEPRMRQQLFEAVEAGEAGDLDASVIQAVALIRDPRVDVPDRPWQGGKQSPY